VLINVIATQAVACKCLNLTVHISSLLRLCRNSLLGWIRGRRQLSSKPVFQSAAGSLSKYKLLFTAGPSGVAGR
jgi:hypothetical protein